MAKKAKKKATITCEYCEHFHSARKRTFGGSVRFCKSLGGEVSVATDACSDFLINSYFWCKSCANRIHVQMCKSRKCKCSQKDVIKAGETHTLSYIANKDLTPKKNKSLPL